MGLFAIFAFFCGYSEVCPVLTGSRGRPGGRPNRSLPKTGLDEPRAYCTGVFLGILDRYLLKNFLVPFFYALFGSLGIWLVYDLGVEGPRFLELHLSFRVIALYYLAQVPYMLVLWMPLAVLLGLLYVLTRMSRRNEIVAMLGAGRSVPRVLFPLMLSGLLLSGVCIYLNYELAPKGYYVMNNMMDEVSKGHSKITYLDGHVFVNRRAHRIWFIQLLNTRTNEVKGLEITQQDKDEVIQWVAYAKSAVHDTARQIWILYDGKISQVDADGNVTDEEFFNKKEISGWSETIWQLGSSALAGRMMTVPELQHYLRVNADFPKSTLAEYRTQLWYRFSLPMNVLLIVLVASPLCVVFSRRGALGGVAGGLFLFILLFGIGNVFTALGTGSRVSPLVAAWSPVAAFFLIGVLLVYLRSTHRSIPFLG
jgi:lipopolysaccharide export system permease protein